MSNEKKTISNISHVIPIANLRKIQQTARRINYFCGKNLCEVNVHGRAALTLAYSIVLRHFAELVVPGLGGVGFHSSFYVFNIIMFAKIRRFYDCYKFFTKNY